MKLNLARRPFVNSRPVTRLAIGLWVAGTLLCAWNLVEGWSLWSELGRGRASLAERAERSATERAAIAELERSLAGIDLKGQNEEIAALNREIAARTFSWTRLFAHLGEILPRRVRLVRVDPQFTAESEGSKTMGPSRQVVLRLAGMAENDAVLLDLVDAMFAHPAFARPNLKREAMQAGQPESFDLEVRYDPLGATTPWQPQPGRHAAAERPEALAPAPAVAPPVVAVQPAPAPTPVPTAVPAGAGPVVIGERAPAPAVAGPAPLPTNRSFDAFGAPEMQSVPRLDREALQAMTAEERRQVIDDYRAELARMRAEQERGVPARLGQTASSTRDLRR